MNGCEQGDTSSINPKKTEFMVIDHSCSTCGTWTTLWPAMLPDMAHAEVKADRELYCIY